MKTLALAEAVIRGTTWLTPDGVRDLLRRGRLLTVTAAGLGVLVGLAMIVFMLVGIYRSLLLAGTASGHPEISIFYGLLGSWVFLFLTAIPLALSVLYYSRDLRLLLTLPLRPLAIVGAKGAVMYLTCLPVNAVFLLPAMCISVRASGITASAAVSGLAVLVLGPALPLSLAVLAVLGLVKAVNLTRYRIAFEAVGMGLGIVLVIGLQAILARSTIGLASGSSPQALTGIAELYTRISHALPPAAWAVSGFGTNPGVFPLLLFVSVSAAALAAALGLAPLHFLSDVMERREAQGGPGVARRGRSGVGDLPLHLWSPARGILRSLLAREWALISSNSTFLFKAISELLVLPLLLGVYGLILPRQLVGQAMGTISSTPMLSLALMGVVALMTSLTTVSSTSLSREGRRMSLSLMIPVRGRVQVWAKLVFHLLLFYSAYLVDLALGWLLFRFPPVSLVFMLPGGLALQAAGFAAGIFFDLKRPRLMWTHPQQAMKNNMNAAAGIGCSAAAILLIVGPFVLGIARGLNPFAMGCAAGAAAIVLAGVLLPRLFAFADRQYAGGIEIEG